MQNNFTIEEVRNFWNKTAPIYESSNKQFKETHCQRFRQAIQYLNLKPKQKVLNIWSRTGSAIPYLRQQCPDIEISNLEVSPEFIKIAQNKFRQERFQETDLEHLPFSSNYFDYVLCLETLEHTPKPLVFLKELQRTLKLNALLVMSLPPKTAELPLRIYEIFFKNHGEGPHQFLSSKTVRNLLWQAGFALKSHKGTLLIPLGPPWLKRQGEKIIDKFQNTALSELGIRQFYAAKKQSNSNF